MSTESYEELCVDCGQDASADPAGFFCGDCLREMAPTSTLATSILDHTWPGIRPAGRPIGAQ